MKINHNISALNAWRNLGISNSQLGGSVEKLSSGMRINRGADDPAGLLISEKLRSQIGSLDQAIKNASDAVSMIQTAEGALTEMNSILNSIRSLAIHASNSGAVDEASINADQDAVDRAITAMQRIANTTKFAGKYLLQGDTTTNALEAFVPATGVSFAGLSSVLPTGLSGTLDLEITTAATQAATIGLAVNVSAALASGMKFEINGVSLAIAAGSAGTGNDINTVDKLTSVLNTTFGAGTFTVVTGGAALSGSIAYTAAVFGDGGTLAYNLTSVTANASIAGVDMVASIGGSALTVSGLALTGASGALSGLRADLTSGANTVGTYSDVLNIVTAELTLQFSLSDDASSEGLVSYGLSSMQAANIGNVTTGLGANETAFNTNGLESITSGRTYNLTNAAADAVRIIDQAVNDVSQERANLGAFQKYTLETTINNLGVTKENLTASESRIRDVDMAEEMMEFTKNQILVQAGTAMLAQANQLPSSVLQLLQG